MLNIIYDNIVFSLQKSGGISVYWKELIERMIANKTIDLKMIEYKKSQENIFRKQLKISNKNIQRKSSFPSISICRYFNLRNSSNKKAIFHSSYYRTMRGRNIINVVTVHDFTYEKKIKTLTGNVHIYQKKKALEKADGIICISQNTKKDMLDLYPKLKNKNIKVIYNGFNSRDYFQIPEVESQNTVLFVGSRKGYKNFNEAVEIISRLEDVSLTIVGGPLNNEERSMLNKKLPGRHQLYTHISNDELNILYNKAICLVYLSEYEGFGIPILEAMAAGCPVLALDKSSIPEVAGRAGILFNKLDREFIGKTIIKLRDNKDFREEKIKLGLENCKRFSWEKCYEEALDFYHELFKE